MEPIREAKGLWHVMTAEQALAELGAAPCGLTAAEAQRRRQIHGSNSIARTAGEGPLQILWRQVHHPLVYVLLGSAALATLLGKGLDGLVVFGVVALNTGIGFLQEYRAGKSIEALAQMVPDQTSVIRDGTERSLDAAHLVPGDLVALRSGDKVPADLRLLSVRGLLTDESALTGESLPVAKHPDPLDAGVLLADRSNMVYGGTLVTWGSATGLVVATGRQTELGRISAMLQESAPLETPLTRSLAQVGKWLTIGILMVSALLFGVGLLRGYPLTDALLAAITLAVAAIPEGLPALITIALAVGVRRMAGRRAIVRHLPAVETLGSTTVICSDKTGTLTCNAMTVRTLWTPEGSYENTGAGYRPDGLLIRDGEALRSPPAGAELLVQTGLLCSDATLELDGGVWKINGDPTEGALVVAAEKLGLDPALRQRFPRVDVIPFESERQFMATLHMAPESIPLICLKGAPEAVLARCVALHTGEMIDWERVMGEVDRMAGQGMRVLAFAVQTVPGIQSLTDQLVASGFLLVGLQGMIDPPRPEAVAAVQACHRAGITVKMITGDHLGTAEAIGRQLGILHPHERGMTGAALSAVSDGELLGLADEINIFARVAPDQKLQLVRALQAKGHVVAMTGDGVNDGPALKQANIGVAMGITGTAVAKEASAIVLADDNFASIRAAVEEGRRVYDNLVKSLAFVLPTNLGEALIILIAVLFFPLVNGVPVMPILPVQILWINLVATVTLALPLAFEAREPRVMARPPRRSSEPLLNRFVWFRTGLVAMLMTAGALGAFLLRYHAGLQSGTEPGLAMREAQTLAVTVVTLLQVFYLLNCRSLQDSVWQIGLLSNMWIYGGIGLLLALQALFVHLPAMNLLFGSAPLTASDWLTATAIACLIVPVIALEKRWRKGGRTA